MKNITVLGTVGKQPETRTTQSGKQVTGVSLAVDDGWGDNKRTLWFDAAVWGKRGEVISGNVGKGDKLCVTGELSTREHEGKTYLTINVSDFSFAGKSQSNQGGNSQGGGYGNQSSQQPANNDLDDEIPF